MTEIITDTGRHKWVEILHGGKYDPQEAYLCLRCGQRKVKNWNGQGPENEACPHGDKIIDRSILKRQPGKDWRSELGMNQKVNYPIYWLVRHIHGNLCPIVFSPNGVNGFVTIKRLDRLNQTIETLFDSNYPTNDLQLIKIGNQEMMEEVISLSQKCDMPIKAIYCDMLIKPLRIGDAP